MQEETLKDRAKVQLLKVSRLQAGDCHLPGFQGAWPYLVWLGQVLSQASSEDIPDFSGRSKVFKHGSRISQWVRPFSLLSDPDMTKHLSTSP